MFNVNEIKSQLVGGGARQSLFRVQYTNPVTGQADQKVPYLVKAASIPDMTLGTIPVPYFGRKIMLAGDRTYDPWDVTVINDEDFLIRDSLEQWSGAINSLEGNIRGFGGPSPLLYKTDAIVTQLGKTGTTLRQYTFRGLYPSNITRIQLDWNATDQIEEFSVRFMYDTYEVTGGITGTGAAV